MSDGERNKYGKQKRQDIDPSSSCLEQLHLQRKQWIEHFRTQHHSLRVSASNIAAIAGFHPWKNLPELFLYDMVYQGSIGKELLQHDAALLGLNIVDPDQMLLELARKAGDSAGHALRDALRIKDGSKFVPTVQAATAVKQKVIKEARKSKLSKTELKVLEEGVRSVVNTGYGTAHEDNALDLYQQQTGWLVEERNAEVRVWPFGLDDDGDIPTVVPLCKASALRRSNNSADAVLKGAGKLPSKPSIAKRPKVVDLLEGENRKGNELESSEGRSNSTAVPEKPFFSILGSVDGIRDELAVITPTGDRSNTDEFGDDWQIRRVIVECKHRMRKIQPIPPLFEQIQTTAYCLMYDVADADIVQVLRTRRKSQRDDGENRSVKAATRVNAPAKDQSLLDPWLKGDVDTMNGKEERESHVHCSDGEEEIRNFNKTSLGTSEASEDVPKTNPEGGSVENESKTKKQQSATDLESKICIKVTRVSLDDQIMDHRRQWKKVILPRLRSFVAAVYNVRKDDDKRYRMLSAISDQTDEEAPWRILFAECPWLESCDTAFHNGRA